MLKKGFRLKRNEDFSKVFRFGKPFFVDSIGCKAMRNGSETTLVGISVAKKLFPKASERNRVKRVFSHVLEEAYIHLPSGISMIFFYRKKPTEFLFDVVKTQVSAIIADINKYSGNKRV